MLLIVEKTGVYGNSTMNYTCKIVFYFKKIKSDNFVYMELDFDFLN